MTSPEKHIEKTREELVKEHCEGQCCEGCPNEFTCDEDPPYEEEYDGEEYGN